MRSTHSQSHPLLFSVVSRTLPDESTVVGICEQADPADGFLVTVERPGGNPSIYRVHLTEPELQILGRVIQQRFGDRDPLIGQFVHVLKDGKIEKQGHVGGSPQPGYYLVTFFGRVDGEKNGSEIVKFTDMIDEDWVFYDDEDRWRSIGDEHVVTLS